MKKFDYGKISDPILREYIQDLQDEINNQAILKGEWKYFEYEFDKAETNLKVPHNLKFTPIDVVQTYISGSGSITWNYSSFDGENVDITTSDACIVKAFIGRYRDENV